jgi:ABC-2 type transport system ATP-binding protein
MVKPSAIEVLELTHRYDSHTAVDSVSFRVETGSIFGLLGPNGAGKSTLMKMLTTLLPPTLGTARIAGKDIIEQPTQVREKIGYVPQQMSADRDLSGYENLLFSAELYGLNRAERKKRIQQVLELMNLKEFAHQRVGRYSGGMMRRLEIAQALIHQPRVLFLDEPTAGLDPVARRALWENIATWRATFETTILLTTHDMDEADRLCDIIAFMYLGRIVSMDTPANLKALLGDQATLNDVFIACTGRSIKGEEGEQDVR